MSDRTYVLEMYMSIFLESEKSGINQLAYLKHQSAPENSTGQKLSIDLTL